jgi:hypothetical protein
VAGIIVLDKFNHDNRPPGHRLIVVMVLILLAYFLVMWRCSKNLNIFRRRLKRIIRDGFPVEARQFFDNRDESKEDVEGAIVADEGTIITVAILLVGGAFAFSVIDMFFPLW